MHDIKIVREFTDTEHLAQGDAAMPSLVEMMDWISQRDDVGFILCSDATRLHRFPKQAAMVARCGKPVISVAYEHFAPSSPPALDP